MKKLMLTAAVCGLMLPALAHQDGKETKQCPLPGKSCCQQGSSKAALMKSSKTTKTVAAKTVAVAGTKTAVYSVSGMECEGCSGALQAGLAKEKGVRDAKVDFKAKRATLKFDGKQTDAKKLEAAFGRKGFPAKLVKS